MDMSFQEFQDHLGNTTEWFSVSESPCLLHASHKVRKRAKIRNRYNQVSHLTQDTNEKEPNSELDITSESQEVSPFPARDNKGSINTRSKAKQTQDRNNMNDLIYWFRVNDVEWVKAILAHHVSLISQIKFQLNQNDGSGDVKMTDYWATDHSIS